MRWDLFPFFRKSPCVWRAGKWNNWVWDGHVMYWQSRSGRFQETPLAPGNMFLEEFHPDPGSVLLDLARFKETR